MGIAGRVVGVFANFIVGLDMGAFSFPPGVSHFSLSCTTECCIIGFQAHMTDKFRIGLTRDFIRPDGSPAFGDVGVDLLSRSTHIEWDYLPEKVGELRPEDVRPYDGIL